MSACKQIDLEQGSAEWLEWRSSRIMASDMPVIMGVSRYSTPYKLWRQKTGFAPPTQDNFAMRQGRELEPLVRELVNEKLSLNLVAAVVTRTDIDSVGASLDGVDWEKGVLAEIKVVGAELHAQALKQLVPAEYWPQVQWQLFCAHLEKGYYCSHNLGSLAIVPVERDDDYIAKELLPAAAEFYKCLCNMVTPELAESDVMTIVSPEFEQAARDWLQAKHWADFYNAELDTIKEKLISYTDDGNCEGYGVTVRRINREGSTDYKKLLNDIFKEHPDLANTYSLDKYQKESVGYWKISHSK